MHIGMAVRTGSFSLGKYQGLVTGPAVGFPVASFQGPVSLVMVKSTVCSVQFPAVSIVTNIAAFFKLVPMR
jgi:hypothetical protein